MRITDSNIQSSILDDRQTNRQVRTTILRLAWPVVMRMLFQGIVGMVDIMMVGRLGPSSIAAVSVANRLVFILIGALQALAVGATALVAQYTGAGRKKQANQVVWQALMGAFLLAVLLSTIGLIFAPSMIRGMLSLMENIDESVVQQATIYLRIILISMIFGLPQILINAIFQGFGDMKTPLYIMTIGNLLNVVGNYVLIFGVGPFPALGVTGAAIATGFARVVGCSIGLFFLIRGTAYTRLDLKQISFCLNVRILRNILGIGIPASLEQFTRQSVMIVYSFLVASLGTLSLAANEILMNVQAISFMPGFGLGVAATTLVGQSLGANNKELAERYGLETMKLGVLVMGSAAVIFLIWPQLLISLYTNDPQVLREATSSMRIVGFLQPLVAVYIILAGALRGAGDTKWVLYVTFIGNWGVRLVLGVIVAFYFSFGLIGFWVVNAIDIAVRALLIFCRYRSGLWKTRVIEDVRVPSKETVVVGPSGLK